MMTLSISRRTDDEYVRLDGETYFRIANSHLMPSFFMSLVGASDHWMFVSSTGAVTAGRCDPDSALFPYAADDQLTAAQAYTGPLTLIRDPNSGAVWRPFDTQQPSTQEVQQNLYKNPLGNKLVFEEVNAAWGLAFRYRWSFSERFGFVRNCQLENTELRPRTIEILDGLQNLLPYGVGSEFMMRFSNLANAYKRAECLDEGLALFYLSSIPTDRAEPSEGLKATVVWQTGLESPTQLLSTEQLDAFLRGEALRSEQDIRGKTGAFLVSQALHLQSAETRSWQVVADLAQDHKQILNQANWLAASTDPSSQVETDIALGTQAFERILASSDAIQCSGNLRRANRHLSNTVFNVMRGGIPLENYKVHADDFYHHVSSFNRGVAAKHGELLQNLPAVLDHSELQNHLAATSDPDLVRLGSEYLPLAFSRRHGDPTRPWNRFAIQLRSNTGRINLNYQGNWRDIFQNWEALALSFPGFLTSMISRFVNATTADGYNPYRVTKLGFEWEEPTPDDPWANIGYWGDHQIIYLLKLLEWNQKLEPEKLTSLLSTQQFVHANVPYRIKPFEDIRQDPQSTIVFDPELSASIADRTASIGSDGKLLVNQKGDIQRVSLLEKLLTLSLAKLSNFIPDGGIWLNTQRPEWNDANNALVGNGISMVTACYLYRWFRFLHSWLIHVETEVFEVDQGVHTFFHRICSILTESAVQGSALSPLQRSEIVEALGRAGADYRNELYTQLPVGESADLNRTELLHLFNVASRHLETTIRNNRRDDGLYHAYNLLRWTTDGIEVEYLDEMLEGQVAVLSSGLLSAQESIQLLDALKASRLYRSNQDSYMLYPDRQLPKFLDKNTLPANTVAESPLLQKLLELGDESIINRDHSGGVHFNGSFRNSADLEKALQRLPKRLAEVAELAKNESNLIVAIFEDLFDHHQFTGRSGTFFAYEGLGSIYWHMVSKLGLAVSETFFRATEEAAETEFLAALREHYFAIRNGIGSEKSPKQYGAFPSDPYSHTPENAGVKQPGMTGQVKEDILARQAELGVYIQEGCLGFRFDLLHPTDLLEADSSLQFEGISGGEVNMTVPAGGLAFTLCQVPIIYTDAAADSVTVHLSDGANVEFASHQLDLVTSRKIFARTGEIQSVVCNVNNLRGRVTGIAQ